MRRHSENQPFSQRQLRVGELVKQSLGQIFLREEAKVTYLETRNITVTEVRMSADLKNARAYVMPLGGKDRDLILDSMNKKKYIFQKYLSSAKLQSKFTPKINFFIDDTFDEAEKIKKLLLDKKVLRDLNE